MKRLKIKKSLAVVHICNQQTWLVTFLTFSPTTDSFEVSVGDELVFSKLESKEFLDAEQVCVLTYCIFKMLRKILFDQLLIFKVHWQHHSIYPELVVCFDLFCIGITAAGCSGINVYEVNKQEY